MAHTDTPMIFDKGPALLAVHFILAPTISDVFQALNEQIAKENKVAGEIKEIIIKKILMTLFYGRKNLSQPFL